MTPTDNLHTTVLGDCEVCNARDVQVSHSPEHSIEARVSQVLACDSCRGIEPRKIEIKAEIA